MSEPDGEARTREQDDEDTYMKIGGESDAVAERSGMTARPPVPPLTPEPGERDGDDAGPEAEGAEPEVGPTS